MSENLEARAAPPRMRVLWGLSGAGLGGVPAQTLRLLPLAARAGLAVHIAGPGRGELFPALAAAAAGHLAVDLDRARPGNVATVARYCRRHGVELLHSHGKGAGLAFRPAGRWVGRPVVHSFRGFSALRFGGWRRPLYLAGERLLATWSQALVAVSPSEAAGLTGAGIAPAARIRIIPNGIDAVGVRARALSRAEARGTLALDERAAVVGTIARPDPVKDLDAVVRIAAYARSAGLPVRFVVIGIDSAAPGPGERLARLSGALDAPVQWVPPRAEAWRFLPAFDLYLSTSITEGFPNAPLEAAALGLPALLSDVQGHRDVIVPGATGRLYIRGDEREAARQIGEFFAGRWAPFSAAAAATLLSSCSLEQQAQRLAELYRALASARSGRPRPGQGQQTQPEEQHQRGVAHVRGQ